MKPVLANWTIVILGHWNIGIFNPPWLGENVFGQKELLLEFPTEPGLPLRFTADNVVLIPASDRLILGAKEASDECLRRMEGLAVTILEKLPHTPVRGVGINFAYEVQPIPGDIESAFRQPHAGEYANHELEVVSKVFKWGCRYEDQLVNVEFDIGEERLQVRFNFHSDTSNAGEAKAAITGNVLPHRAFGERILDEIYDLRLEES